MADKHSYVVQMGEFISPDIRWDKLPKEDLAVLTNLFSNKKVLILSLLEQMEDEARQDTLASIIQMTAPVAGDSDSTGMPLVDELLKNRPVIRKLIGGR
jgi:hypothetical protein